MSHTVALNAANQVVAAGGVNATSSIIGLVVSLVIAFACYKIAQSKGRGPVLWGVLGFFFTIITLIVLLILPKKN